ncbi:MAG: Gfo/Idh/MocA family oxidoreductase [bacterium]|nr:Gfo/Idh/MocA family oxidoreductase [bacterium]
MKILVQNKWEDDYLDYFRSQKEYRIKVLAIKNLEKIGEVYIIRPKSLRMVWNYVRKYGPKAVYRKVISRLSEESRNNKYVSLGIGEILETEVNPRFNKGNIVAFIAPLHPAAIERITLPENFIYSIDQKFAEFSKNKLAYIEVEDEKLQDGWWTKIKAWSIYSGIIITKETENSLMENVLKFVNQTDWSKARFLDISSPSSIKEFKIGGAKKFGAKKSAALLGFGNYAKVQILPNIKPYIKLFAVHEIDPTQIIRNLNVPLIDTSPNIRPEEKYDAYFIAGYHHTHTPLALEALKKGAYAVVEKPVAVDREQLKSLLEAVEVNRRKLFIGFHKRYSIFNSFAFEDLGTKKGEAISYHCIVHEPKYPKYFWYNWPNSKGPIIENGCHWIDHFLFLNNYSKPVKSAVFISKNGIINASAELENGACFTMVLTGEGSDYMGVQDYVELKTKDKTIKIINDDTYIAEGKDKIIRKKNINKMLNYKTMYQAISKKIAKNEEGDGLNSLLVSSELIFDLEDKFRDTLLASTS